MRTAAIVYIVLSVAANFWYGTLSTFALAAFSFPVLVWRLLQKRKNPKPVVRADEETVQ